MKKSEIVIRLGSIMVLMAFFSACSIISTNPTDLIEINENIIDASNSLEGSVENIADMPNPSSVYCEGLGYSMENVLRDDGADADCIFPDGSRCAAWDFLSGRCGQEFTICEMQGNTIEEGANISSCRFPDNSYCDEYLFFTGECSKGDNPEEVVVETIQIFDFSEARDFIAAYFYNQYGIEQSDSWMEQNITPDDAVGTSTIRFVSGLLTIVISAPASAPYIPLYTVEEASYIANGFYWEGTLSFEGEITENIVIPPAPILNEELARDAVLDYLVATYEIPAFGEWEDQGFSQTGNDTILIIYTSHYWTVAVEFAPSAPLASIYLVTVENLSEAFRWEGDISLQGEIVELSFSK